MRQLIFIGTIVGLAVLTSGCASTQRSHNYIDADARPHIQELDSVLLADQDELEADINVSKISTYLQGCLLYTSPSPRDKRQSRMPSSA